MRLDVGDLASVAIQFESDGNQNFSMTMGFEEMMGPDAEGFGFEIRFIDDVSYVRFVVPESMQGLVGDAMPDGWFTLDAETADEMGIVCPSPVPSGTLSGGVCQLPNDSTFLIEHVIGAEIAGDEDIDGSVATHVRFTVDAAALASELSAAFGDDDDTEGGMPFGEDLGPEELALDAWIDSDGLIRRLSLDLGAALAELMGDSDESESGGFEDAFASLFDLTSVVNFYDYDADIAIEAPPANEILGDFGDMMGPGGFGADSGAEIAE